MKKGLLFAAAAMLMASSVSAADWYLCGSAVTATGGSSWGDVASLKLTPSAEDANVLTIKVAKLQGVIKIKEAGTWSTSFGSNGTKLKEGELYKAGTDGSDINIDGVIEDCTLTVNVTNRTVLAVGKSSENQYDTVYLVGDFGSGWSESNTNYPLALAAGSTNVWEGSFTLSAAKSYFKMKAGALIYGTGGADIAVELGKDYTAAQSGNAYSIAAGKYNFKFVLDKNADTGVLTVTQDGPVTYPESIVVIGNILGVTGEWDSSKGVTLEKVDEGIYRGENITVWDNQASGFGYIAFAEHAGAEAGDWNLGTRWGPESKDFTPTAGVTSKLVVTDANSLKLVGNSAYTITVSLKDMVYDVVAYAPQPEQPKLELGKLASAVSAEMKYVEEGDLYDNYYEINIKTSEKESSVLTFALPEGYDKMLVMVQGGDVEPIRRVAASDLTAAGFTEATEITVPTGVTDYMAAVAFVKGEEATEPYTLLINSTYDSTVAVEAIEVAEGEAEYYNLQGVRVANPENGIYVKVVNGKAAKVVL